MLMKFRMFALGAMALALLVASAPAFAAEEVKDSPHAAHLLKCATACADCQIQCDVCFKHCLDLAAGGKKDHAKMAQLCADCGECCKTCATLCARQSPLARTMLECCVTCCDDCALECEKASDNKHIADCAKSCRSCAKECRELAKMIK